MVSGPLSPATWTRVLVRAAETIRPESTQKPSPAEGTPAPADAKRVESAGFLAAVGKSASETRTEQTQTVDAVARRRPASLRSLVPEGEEEGASIDDRAPRGRNAGQPRRGAPDDFSRSSGGDSPSYVLGADGRLYAVGGRDAEGGGSRSGAEESGRPPGADAERLGGDAPAGAPDASPVLVGLPSTSDLASAAALRAEAERTLRARRQAGSEAGPGREAGPPRGENLFAPEAPEEPFFARQKPEEPLFRAPRDEAFLGPRKKEKASLFEVEDVKPIFDRRERESLYDVSGGEPIFQPPAASEEDPPALIDDTEVQELLDQELQDRYKQIFTAFMAERSRS